MKKRSLFKIFEDFSSKQLSKINSILDAKPADDRVLEDRQHDKPSQQESKDKSTRLITALDVGSSKVTAIIGRLNPSDRIEILGVGYAVSDGLIRGSVSNIAKTSAAIKLALADASQQANVPVQEVYSSYSGVISNHVEHGVLLRNDPSTEVSSRDIEKLRLEMFNAVLPPGEQLIYMQAQTFTIDDEPGIKDPVGMSGKRIEADFQLITAGTTPIEYLQKCCAQANVSLKQVIPAAVASAEAVICEEEMEEGIAVIDIGAAVTSVAVYNKGNLIHAENIPLGGNNISADIRDFTGLQLKQAELMKNQFGDLNADAISVYEVIEAKILNGTKMKQVPRKALCEVIRSRAEELISIAYSIVHQAMRNEKLIFGIVFTGGTSALPNFKELAHEITGEECHLGVTSLHLADHTTATLAKRKDFNVAAHSTAVGLLRIGLTGS